MQNLKTSQQFTSPASFLKKQSHIITNNISQDFYPNTPTTRYLMEKQMHRSHFHSEANSNKYVDIPTFFDEEDSEICSEDKEKKKGEENSHNNNPNDVQEHPFDSFYQSEDVSSEQERSGTKSQKKIGFGSIFKDHTLKKVSSNCSNKGQGKFLFINSKKQKYNNNYLFQNSVDTLKEEIQKYENSIDKLKEQNLKLRSQKIKLSSSNESMHLIELRLELEALKKRIKQLETEKQMHLTINSDKTIPQNHSNLTLEHKSHSTYHENVSFSQPITASEIKQVQSKEKKGIPTFRAKSGAQAIINGQYGSPRAVREEAVSSNYHILQNMKSPYFLKKT